MVAAGPSDGWQPEANAAGLCLGTARQAAASVLSETAAGPLPIWGAPSHPVAAAPRAASLPQMEVHRGGSRSAPGGGGGVDCEARSLPRGGASACVQRAACYEHTKGCGAFVSMNHTYHVESPEESLLLLYRRAARFICRGRERKTTTGVGSERGFDLGQRASTKPFLPPLYTLFCGAQTGRLLASSSLRRAAAEERTLHTDAGAAAAAAPLRAAAASSPPPRGSSGRDGAAGGAAWRRGRRPAAAAAAAAGRHQGRLL